jgi:hypothetical protein
VYLRQRHSTVRDRIPKVAGLAAILPGASLIFAGLLATPAVWAQDAPHGDSPAVAPVVPVVPALPTPVASHTDPFNEDRIMKVMPDYQTVRDPNAGTPPLTNKQKWLLAWKETVDPFNIASAALAAGLSQAAQQTPKYGVGGVAYTERFGAAVADFGSQNFISAGVLAVWWHQDPRYFRKGPGSKIPARVAYAVKALFVCHNDARKSVFNSSGIVGMMMGIGASNLYYPPASRRGDVMAGRVQTSLFGGVVGNLTSEFWPDLEKKFFHHKQN